MNAIYQCSGLKYPAISFTVKSYHDLGHLEKVPGGVDGLEQTKSWRESLG